MSDYETKGIFAYNLGRILADSGQNQADLARILGVSKSTVSSWCTGEKMPRMDKIEALARHFSINKSTLLDSGEGEANKLDAYDRQLLSETRALTEENKQKVLELSRFFKQLQDGGF